MLTGKEFSVSCMFTADEAERKCVKQLTGLELSQIMSLYYNYYSILQDRSYCIFELGR